MIFLVFFLGICVGSFLNVLIDRLPKNKTVVLGRSRCDYCRHKLAWYDLIPLLSFFFLGQKCRYCRKKLSWQYPIVEFMTGIVFAFIGYTNKAYLYSSTPGEPFQVTPGVSLVYLFVIVSGLLVIFFTDLKYRIIPDQILFILLVTTLPYLLIYSQSLFIHHLISAVLMLLLFLLLVIITRGRGMGLGDVKYAFLMGLILGFPKIIIAFYLAFLTGACISLILVMGGKKTIKSTIPFGPFLVLATFICLFYGERLWEIFKKVIGI
jgi:prepilin signal peptidase PulO-like enzyme (type II secretory pathway)